MPEIEILDFIRDERGYKIGTCEVKITHAPEKWEIFRNVAVFHKEDKKWVGFPNVKKGDKCYIISNGLIIGYHIIKYMKFVDEDEAKELSDGNWKEGYYIIRDANSFVELKEKPKVCGFQSFRYFDRFLKRWNGYSRKNKD